MGNLNVREQMQNLGIQMINLGILTINNAFQIPNIGTDNSFLKQQITSIEMQLQNFQMQLNNNMGMMNNNMGMMNNNFGMMNNNMGMMMDMMTNNISKEEFNEDNKNKLNFIFTTIQGIKTTLIIDSGTSVGELLKIYLRRVNHPELINNTKDLCFISNAKVLNFEDKTKVEDYFKDRTIINIIVNDFKNLIT